MAAPLQNSFKPKAAKLLGIGDAFCALYKKDGINIAAVMEYATNNNKSLVGYQEDSIQVITNAKLLTLDVDVGTKSSILLVQNNVCITSM
ncbi:MAG: hypothetical protein H6Q73_4402 [Firmicutes bacterium]|nr:hypothetical protein [Bacillota bacterium]